MIEAALVGLLFAISVACILLLRRDRSPSAIACWGLGCVVILTSSLAALRLSDALWAPPVNAALTNLYAALMLSGALVYAARRVPVWILPAAAGLGLLRGLLALQGVWGLPEALCLAGETSLLIAAAAVVLRAPLHLRRTPAQRTLPAAFLAMAALDVWSLFGAWPSLTVPPVLAGAWAASVPLLFALQISAEGHRARAELEQARRESEERYRIFSELSSDYAFAMRMGPDHLMTLEWATAAMRRITGYSAEEMQGDRWRQLIPAEDLEDMMDRLDEALAGRIDEIEFRFRNRSGEERWLKVRFGMREQRDDGTVRAVGSASDVTARKQAQQERARLESHMREAQRLESLGLMAGGIAHDFNNALTVIQGNTHLGLADSEVGSSVHERLTRIRAAADYAAGLTRQILTYAGKASVELEPLDLSELARGLVDLLRASLGEKAELEVDLCDAVPLVDGDETQLSQVVVNLVSNASEALGEGPGRVRLSTGSARLTARDLSEAFGDTDRGPGEYVFIEVSDTGAGMEDALISRVFEPFFTTKSSGRGLGLAMVFGIVIAHHGVISIRSQPRRGTTFRTLFPLSAHAQQPRSGEIVASDARQPQPSVPLTVLVVDDDEWVLEVAREFLRREGFSVVTASGGREGIDTLRARRDEINVVVLDLAMPDMSGEKTLSEMREIKPDLRVVLASGYDKEHASRRFPARGVAGFLSKPYPPEELIRQVTLAAGD